MKQWKTGWMATALVVGLAMPGSVLAVQQPLVQANNVTLAHGDHGKGQVKMRYGMHMGAHQRMYMTLLAEKYTPNSVGEWQSVMKERERLLEQLRSARETASEEKSKMKDQLREKVKSGEISSEQMEQQYKEWKEKNRGTVPSGEKENREAQREKFKQVHEEFDAAIASGDAAKIKAALPKLLEQMKAKNDRLAKRLAEKQK
ncbi:hypothetical protein P9761_26045 [Brevibacillus centrosporus]|uniref:hypothetical protein n=1 Tax=Brevibacillus centrosporus TaxID=54910 RepID=UPI000F0A1E01|nr:hypothetical protein [Brevibacillus centrosporus]MEC2127918.1 hypothetical protein [Brevibacillus centrosporus]MED4911643.1 hypothetical protein [Brevibacillus centrosporus]RNB68196.1 hypothetical protein EDM55_17650 [Brevibacillus centrosporus]GED32837.1 hypothetical protein BCE02nite_39780 [Brevibacillus centrosporus]